ncbi:DUF423 domain-containing protein [bacterium BMS3Abin03]|jgi:uncharacterized membrane protein YgdD (TMEM256/DUF423 family)|nr:DUF423 domain-containing protein [bacterium BMS3Abin03]
MSNQKVILILAGFLGLMGVALGAFGAHRLADILSPGMMEIYKTGILYHLIHSVTILSIALVGREKFFKAAYVMIAGIILFSGSLYIYAQSGNMLFAMITPVGGICFLIGWLLIVFEAIRMKKNA